MDRRVSLPAAGFVETADPGSKACCDHEGIDQNER